MLVISGLSRGVAGWMAVSVLSSMVAADGHLSTGDPLQALPDVFPPAQSSFDITITYKGGAVCDSKHGGVEFSIEQTTEVPSLFQSADGTVSVNDLHTLVMIDPDAPNRQDNSLGEVLHLVQTDLLFSEGNLISTLEPLVPYAPPAPPEGSGPHRYIYLLFRQPSTTVNLGGFSADSRTTFDVVRFARENQFGAPISGCFFVVNGGGDYDVEWNPEDYMGGGWYEEQPWTPPTSTDCTTTPVPTTTDCTTTTEIPEPYWPTTTETPEPYWPTTTETPEPYWPTSTETPYAWPTTAPYDTTTAPWYPTSTPVWYTSTVPWNHGNYSVTKVTPIPPPVYTLPPPAEDTYTPPIPPVEPPVWTSVPPPPPPPTFPGNGTNGTYTPPIPTFEVPETPLPTPPSPVNESDGAAADMRPVKGSFVAIVVVGAVALLL